MQPEKENIQSKNVDLLAIEEWVNTPGTRRSVKIEMSTQSKSPADIEITLYDYDYRCVDFLKVGNREEIEKIKEDYSSRLIDRLNSDIQRIQEQVKTLSEGITEFSLDSNSDYMEVK